MALGAWPGLHVWEGRGQSFLGCSALGGGPGALLGSPVVPTALGVPGGQGSDGEPPPQDTAFAAQGVLQEEEKMEFEGFKGLVPSCQKRRQLIH